MSGAGVMPYLLRLEKEGFGLEHNVMEIAKQASGLDAILAISLTELGYGFIFANGKSILIFMRCISKTKRIFTISGDLVGGLRKGNI